MVILLLHEIVMVTCETLYNPNRGRETADSIGQCVIVI